MSFLVIFFKDGFVCVENKEDAVLRMLARMWTRNRKACHLSQGRTHLGRGALDMLVYLSQRSLS